MDFVNTSVSFSLDYRLLKPATKTFSFFGTNSNKSWSQDLVYTDVSMGATVQFTTAPDLIQLFDKATSNNLIWYDEVSVSKHEPVCKEYDF